MSAKTQSVRFVDEELLQLPPHESAICTHRETLKNKWPDGIL